MWSANGQHFFCLWHKFIMINSKTCQYMYHEKYLKLEIWFSWTSKVHNSWTKPFSVWELLKYGSFWQNVLPWFKIFTSLLKLIAWLKILKFVNELKPIYLTYIFNWKYQMHSSCCPRRTKFGRGLWNGLRTCVCPCVRPMFEICFFSVTSWPILILFVLSDRAGWRLQNFYTEFWNSLIMQMYANLFKINEKCYFSISWPILILSVLSDRAGWGLQNFYTEFWNSLIMQIYANLFKINEKCYFSVISWPILILFVLSDRAWCGLQNFYTKFCNSLIMQIYSKSMKNATALSFLGRFWLFVLSDRAWCGLQNFYIEFWN